MEGNEMKKKQPDVDQGYAWVILAGCFAMYLFTVGSLKAYGVLYTEMLEHFEAGAGNTAWIGSICLLLMLGLGPFANMLSQRTSFRTVAFTGGILLGIGYFTTGFVPRVEYIFLTFGVFVGLGYGLSFSPCSTIISFYFEEHRALANGITVSASGIGALTFPFLYKFLIETFGFRGTMWIIAAIVLNVCCAAACFKQPEILVQLEHERKKKLKEARSGDRHLLNGNTKDDSPPPSPPGFCANWIPDFKFKLFKNPKFALYVISFTLCMNGYGNNLILIPSHIRSLGYSKLHVVLGVSVMGGCEVISRILFGYIADKQYITRRTLFLFSMTFSSIFVFMAPFFTQFEYFVVYAAIIGIFPGSFWSLISVLVIDAVGLKDFASAFGLVSLCLAAGAFISQPTIGWLQDLTGNWHASFILTGCLLLLSGLVVLLEPSIVRRCTKQEPELLDDTTELQIPLRHNKENGPKPKMSDHDTLMEEDDDDDNNFDVSFSSARISRIYRPVSTSKKERKPSNTSAPLADPNEV